jgi:PAS domain S-box-containing protein
MTLFLDEALRVRWYTPGVTALFPLKASDVGRPITDLAPSFADTCFLDDVDSVMRTGELREGEVRNREGRWYLKRIRPFRTKQSEGLGGAGVAINFTDITERKVVEAALRRSESALASELAAMTQLHEFSTVIMDARTERELLETALDAIIGIQCADFGIVHLHDVGTRTMRIATHRGFDHWFLEYLEGADALADAAFAKAMARRERVSFEDIGTEDHSDAYRAVAKRAGFRAVQATPLLTTGGELVGIISTHFREPQRFKDAQDRATDILANELSNALERIRIETALRANEAQLRAILGIHAVGVVFYDSSGRIIDANDAFLGMTGFEREDLAAGLCYEELTPPEWRKKYAAALAELNTRGESTPGERECICKDRSRIWIHCSGKRLDDGRLAEFVVDITKRREAEVALHESERRSRALIGPMSPSWRP